MKNLLKALWHFIDFIREIVKFGLVALLGSVVALIIVEALIVARQPMLFSPTVALVGFFWILTTMFVLWTRGTFIADKLLILGLLSIEPGRSVWQGVKLFFLLDSSIVVFFFFVPVWKFWAGVFILPVLLTGLALSGNLAKKKWNFILVVNLYTWLIVLTLLAMFFMAGRELLAGQSLAVGIK